MTLSLLDPPDDDDRLPAPEDWPAPLDRAAFHGLAGETVDAIAPHTEADRATRGRTLRVSYADWRIG